MNGLGVQSQNFGIDGGNVRDLMDSPKLFKKLSFRVPGQAGHDKVFWAATKPGREASPRT